MPEGCFEGVENLCHQSDSIEFSCSDNEISEELVESTVENFGFDVISFLEYPDSSEKGLSTSVVHTSTCQADKEILWTEKIEVSSEYGSVVFEINPNSYSASFLAISPKSFGTSSVLYACYILDGNEIEFSVLPGGIVNGFTLSENQYDCSFFVSDTQNRTANLTIQETKIIKYTDMPDDVGIILEYTIVSLYVVFAYFASFQHFLKFKAQKSRTSFKTRMNFSIAVLFFVWATGNLVYTFLFSTVLSDSNFFYIKTVLTITYFTAFYAFTMIVHYRYNAFVFMSSFQGIVGRITRYSPWIDAALIAVTTCIHILYFVVTLLVEFCNFKGPRVKSNICENALNSNSVLLLYQSSK